MKKINYILLTLFLTFFGLGVTNASATYSFNVSSSTITNGGKVTASVTVKNTAAWNIKIISAGSTNGCTNSWADSTSDGKNTTKTFSTTCKASSTGTISFTLSGDITSEDGSTTSLSGSKSVKVKEKEPDSTVNTLKDLSVEGYSFTEEFSKDKLDYFVTVPPTVEKVTINATKSDSTSSITGTGEVTVNEGSNKFEIVVTAQSGDVRTYTVTVNVEDENPIEVEIDGNKYTVVKTSRNLEIPSLYQESSMEMNGVSVPIFVNEESKINLIALKNSVGEIKFFMMDNGNYKPYVEITSNTSIIYPTGNSLSLKNYNEVSITINGVEVKAYQYKDISNSFYLLEGMDLETGEISIYSYDAEKNTLSRWNKEVEEKEDRKVKIYFYSILGCVAMILLCVVLLITSLVTSKKKMDKLKSYLPVGKETRDE